MNSTAIEDDMTPEIIRLLDNLRQVTPNEAQAVEALKTYCMVQILGWDDCKALMPSSTFYRHIRQLRDAGLSKWLVMNDDEAVEKIAGVIGDERKANRIYWDLEAGKEAEYAEMLRKAIRTPTGSLRACHV
ncbi:MAG: hypothetical protein LPK58_01910 [Gammaproteobacteria bacterium]|nr:hypothetical protein [Gammaproteobacteria bacterium]MDX5374478.1 hypothetical protein [Gammaproteobacteria bacterium]